MKKIKMPAPPQVKTNKTPVENTNHNNDSNPLETLKTLIYKTQESNQLKIEFIKEELQAGRYEAQSAQIARKLMEYSIQPIEEPEMA